MHSLKKIAASLLSVSVAFSFASLPVYAYGEYETEAEASFGDSARRNDGLFSEDSKSVLEARFADGKVQFCWNYLVGAEGYKLYGKKADSNEYALIADIKGSACFYEYDGADPFSYYTYTVKAYGVSDSGEDICSAASDDVLVCTGEMNVSSAEETENEASVEGEREASAENETSQKRKRKKKKTESEYSFEVISYRDGYDGWTVTVSDGDIEILEEFAAEHFTEGMSDYEKLEYTAEYIHENVDYAYGNYDEIEDLSYVEAIFVKHTGQCLQYNGALASLAVYLGYDVRLISGNRGTSADNRWSHFWGEINTDGEYHVLDAGNKKDGLYYFDVPYEEADKYMYFDEVLRVSPEA